MTIMLRDIWPIQNLSDYKVHFARHNGTVQPLDVFARDRDEWQDWQVDAKRDRFNRRYIFSLVQFYHETDIWLFGGVYKALSRCGDRYDIRLTQKHASFIGRLKLYSGYRAMYSYPNLENQYGHFEVREILHEPYAGRSFPGLENIDLPFYELETLVRNGRQDWRSPLENVAGIYLITVRRKNRLRRYVGAAYGDSGLWSRWADYVETGHGNNAELAKLVDDDIDRCRQDFRFALLQHMPLNTPQEIVLERENYWKRILVTRKPEGLNRN